jgi:hypothetical protein
MAPGDGGRSRAALFRELEMLFHMSIAAHDPQRVAGFFAEIWGGDACVFPPVTEGSWVAFANDDRSTIIEVYPIDTVLREAEGAADAYGMRTGTVAYTPTHGAVATSLSQEQVLAIAEREGWSAKYCSRGGKFGVIEIWIEGRQMMEILTPEMQREYLDCVTIDNWRRMLAAFPNAAKVPEAA